MQIADGGQNYRVNWNSSNLPSFSTDVSSEIISKFKINTSVFNINDYKSNSNAQCVSTLLNPSYWTGYIDNSKGNNQTAIGGPTVELWMDSWNARYPGQKVYCDSANENGYYFNGSNCYIKLNQNQTDGGELYFANNYRPLRDGNNTVISYWLASPSSSHPDLLIDVGYDGYVGNYGGYGSNLLGVRPVVCLGSGITVKAEDAE